MPDKCNPQTDPGEPTVYQIRVKGHLRRQWADWFEGLTVTPQDNGETLLTGPLIDQAALHGLLKKVRDMGRPLIPVKSAAPGAPRGSNLAKRVFLKGRVSLWNG